MAAVTIRNLPDETHRALKQRAASNGNSTEAEIRRITNRHRDSSESQTPATLDSLLKPSFGNLILPFDQDAALPYAALFAKARSRGVAISTGDAQIAAIAEIHGFAVATRDIAPFKAAGSRVIDPWKA